MNLYHWLLSSILLLLLPVALMAAILPPNEYAAIGLKGAVDCDGPMSVMMFAIPSYVIYGTGALAFIIKYKRSGLKITLLVALACCIVCAVITPNVVAATKQHETNISKQFNTCGKGW